MSLEDLIKSAAALPRPAATPVPAGQSPGSIFDIPVGTPVIDPRPLLAKAKIDYAKLASMSEKLAAGWIKYFAKADQLITWLAPEQEFSFPLDEHTIIIGRIDALGRRFDQKTFFGDWKTAKPPFYKHKDRWKLTWGLKVQSLTYAWAVERLLPGTRMFTVRMAYKGETPTFDYEWFSYTTEEIEWWAGEMSEIAEEIRWRRKKKTSPWAPHFNHCFKYGTDYVCPFYHHGCHVRNWNGQVPGTVPRVPHLQVERELVEKGTGTFGQSMDKKLVVLDASRMDLFGDCREQYRREYEHDGGWVAGDKEDLVVGEGMHDLLEAWYQRLKDGRAVIR